jgi:glycosyltransferase involved in cell wall biosynthesis
MLLPSAEALIIKSQKSTRRGDQAARDKFRVLMLDLLPTVPYYTGYLCEALENCPEVQLSLAATTYSHDSTCFTRARMNRRQVAVDFAARVPASLKPLRRLFKFVEYLFNLGALALQFLFSRPDIMHVQFTPLVSHGLPFEVWFLRWVQALGCKVVYTIHNVLPHDTGQQCRGIYGKIYGLADHLICHDRHTKTAVTTEFQVPAEKVTVIPHGPLLAPSARTTQLQARERLGLPKEGCVVLWQGILRPYKGVPFLLKAWKQACQQGLNATLIIAGTGEKGILDAVTKEVQELGIASSVRLDLRFISVEILENYLSAADILVYPYASVTTSGALMTGIKYGKAVIASSLPAFQELLQHAENGLLVAYDNLQGWAAALQRLVSDADLRSRLGDMLRRSSASRLSWVEIGSETLRVYEQVLTPRSQSPVTTLGRITPALRG